MQKESKWDAIRIYLVGIISAIIIYTMYRVFPNWEYAPVVIGFLIGACIGFSVYDYISNNKKKGGK